MATNTAAIQALYVAYFNRPADVAGLNWWDGIVTAAKGDTSAVSKAFAASDEYKATFAGMDYSHIVATVYTNLFGRTGDAIDQGGLNFWTQALLKGTVTIDNVVSAIAAGAQGSDKVAFADKVAAATAFTNGLDSSSKQLGYSGTVALNMAKGWMATIVDDASLAAAVAPAALAKTIGDVTGPHIPPVTINLTAGIDTPVTTAGDDTIIATSANGLTNNLTTFDNIDGGAGIDTIRFVDAGTAATGTFNPVVANATVTNVEKVSILSTGAVSLNTTGWTGVTDVTVNAAGTGNDSITVSDTTNVTLTGASVYTAAVAADPTATPPVVGSPATGYTTIVGGKAVVVTQGATAADVSVKGAGLTTVSIKGGAVATVDNQGTTGDATTSGKGTSLTSVTLDGVTGTTATLKGASLTNVTLKNIAQNDAVTITNATAKHALNLTVDGAGKVGNATATPPVADVIVTVTDDVATSANVTAAGASDIKLMGAKLAAVTMTGSANITADVTGAALVASVDASAATGAVTLMTGSAVTNITTGSGNDVVTVTTATSAAVAATATTAAVAAVNATVATGAGNDKVTINATGNGAVNVDTGAGNDTVSVTGRGTAALNISMGDGNDVFTSAVAINGSDVIDAGAGIDTLALSLVGAANIGAFSNFDVFDTKAMAKNLDVDILASKNNVTEFVASGDVGGNAALINIGAGINFRATGDMGSTNALTLTQKAAGALTVTLDVDTTSTTATQAPKMDVNATNATAVTAVFDASSANTTAGANVDTIILQADKATSLNIVSGGTNASNVLTFVNAGALTSVTVTGASNLDLAGTANHMTKVTSVDASALTGKLAIDLANLSAGAATVKLGSAADTVYASAAASNANAVDALSGFQKASATAVSSTAAPADKTAAIAAADQVVVTGGAVTANAADNGTFAVKNGVLSFSGAGPSTLAAAFAEADVATSGTAAGNAVVFEYLGNTYMFVQGDVGVTTLAAPGVSANDVVVKLTGITGVTTLAENGTTDHFFLV